jgi:hypothetical protein
MKILKGNDIDWCEKDWSQNSTWIIVLKSDWTNGRQKAWRLEAELDKDAVCHRLYSSYITNTLPRTLLKGLETSKLEDK